VLWSSHFISKPPGDGKRVPWHEDSAYWAPRLSEQEVLTVWLAIDEVKQLLFLLLVDHYLFYSWTYTLASFAFLPTWLLFWALPFCDV